MNCHVGNLANIGVDPRQRRARPLAWGRTAGLMRIAVVWAATGICASGRAQELAPIPEPAAAATPGDADSSPLVRRDRSLSRASPSSVAPAAGGSTWVRTTASLAGVVALILFLAWSYRAVSGGSRSLLGRGRRPGIIEVLSRTVLSPRQSLCLVRIGPRAVLIGVSGDSVRTLDVIDDPAIVAQLAGQAESRARPSFAADLAEQDRAFAALDAKSPAPLDDVAEAAIRTLAQKRRLTAAPTSGAAAGRSGG